MNKATDIHPSAVLSSLQAKGGRSQKQRNLSSIHEVCRKYHEEGGRDFSVSMIGKLCESAGVIKGRALYNAPSADYRALIEAWAAYSGGSIMRPIEALASHEYLLRIEDPAIRSIMQSTIMERDKLKAQLNVLKAHTQITVDRRPFNSNRERDQGDLQVTSLSRPSFLTESERDALKKAICKRYLEEQGWVEGSHGEVVNDRGRTIFEIGFTHAIRKMLES